MNRKLIAALFAVTLSWIATMPAATLTVGNATSLPCTGTFPTIQAAEIAANSGDTISVCPGNYPELVQITKTLAFDGAQQGVDARTRSVPASSESVVGSGDGAFQIEADNVKIDGFTIQGVVNDPSAPPFTGLGAGIWTNPGFSGTHGGHIILNNVIQNNIAGIELDNDGTIPTKVQFNLIKNNNSPGAGSGNGIETNFGLVNATIDSNTFIGQTNSSYLNATGPGSSSAVTVSNNTLDAGVDLFNASGFTINGNTSVGNTAHGTIYLGGGDSNVVITGNVLDNGVEAVVVEDQFEIGSNSDVILSPNNCIAGNSVNGLRVSGYTGTLNATNNWWGAASGPRYNGAGPGTGDNITDPNGVVHFTPFLTSRNGTPCEPPPCRSSTSLISNFNGTAIAKNSFIWFNSVLKPSGLGAQPVTIRFTNQIINSSAFTLSVPDAMVTFDPTATTATTTFTGGMWVTRVPSTGLAGNTFLSALSYQVPANLPGGLKNVSWSGTVLIDTQGVSLQWQWGAAVYKSLNSNYTALGVKPVDDNKASQYKNSDHAGTPENAKSGVTGGATGGGGSNYTGSYSGTGNVTACRQ